MSGYFFKVRGCIHSDALSKWEPVARWGPEQLVEAQFQCIPRLSFNARNVLLVLQCTCTPNEF